MPPCTTMSLFAYFGTPESRSFQFLWTAGNQPLFSVASSVVQCLSHLPDPRSGRGSGGTRVPLARIHGPAATPGGTRPKTPPPRLRVGPPTRGRNPRRSDRDPDGRRPICRGWASGVTVGRRILDRHARSGRSIVLSESQGRRLGDSEPALRLCVSRCARARARVPVRECARACVRARACQHALRRRS
jgi:hypothetical protein